MSNFLGGNLPTREQQETITVGSRVRVTARFVDFHSFRDDTGVVVRNSGKYLGIIVRFDTPIMVRYVLAGDHLMTEFGFNYDDLEVLELAPEAEEYFHR